MASLMPLSPYLSPTVLLLVSCDLGFVRADRPPSPVNVTVTHLRANSATVSWDVPEGNIVIGYSISQQRQNGPGQRVIREVNTTTRACALWGLAEDSDYTVQVRSIGLRGESPPGPRVHFRTLKGSDRLPSNSSSPGDITVEGLDGERPLQTGEVVIIVVVLLMWAAVIGLFCRQYDIIKDNDSNNNPKEKGKGPEHSPQGRPVGTRQVMWGPVRVARVTLPQRSSQGKAGGKKGQDRQENGRSGGGEAGEHGGRPLHSGN
uniref:Fibronectin type III domain containing 4 n=1 Tax=Oryctolagus cuniculus TaxID=9986 RepID=A0A5F9D175_RABIT